MEYLQVVASETDFQKVKLFFSSLKKVCAYFHFLSVYHINEHMSCTPSLWSNIWQKIVLIPYDDQHLSHQLWNHYTLITANKILKIFSFFIGFVYYGWLVIRSLCTSFWLSRTL
jgi:hypothetical protein